MPKLGENHPIFAAVWTCLHRSVNPFRPAVVAPARGCVLEIGAGGGENLPFYHPDTTERLTLTEPDPAMLRRAAARVRAQGLPVQVLAAAAEDLPFPNASFDTVVGTLVLCSVEDPAAALEEVRRVLKPGGTLRFLEHVRSEHPLVARLQDFVTPVNRCLGAGCRPNRDTLGAIRRAGFTLTDLARPKRRLPLYTGTAVLR